MGGTRLNKCDIDRIIEYANTGRSAYEAATAIRRSVGCVYRIAKDNGVSFNGGHRKVGPDHLLTIKNIESEITPFDDLSADLESDLIERFQPEPQPEPKPVTCMLTTVRRTLEIQGEHLRLSIASSGETVICVEIDDICGTAEAACQALSRLIVEASEAMAAIEQEVKA